jgi:hypothetical protein
MDIGEIGLDDVDLIDVTQDRDQGNFGFHKMLGSS